ncbi:MAG: hypothetical protein ACTTH8_03290 [Treponema sp.]
MEKTAVEQSVKIKKRSAVWAVIALIFAAALFFLFLFAAHWYARSIQRISAILSDCTVTNTALPCTVTVIGHGSSTASVHIAFSSPQGRPAGSYERSWQGSKLYLSAYIFRTKRGVLVFPHQFYTKAEKKYKGVTLLRYYTDAEYPVIYDDPALTRRQQNAMKELFKLIRTMPALLHFFGNLQEITGSIDAGGMQTEYVLFVSPNNTLRFIPSVESIY